MTKQKQIRVLGENLLAQAVKGKDFLGRENVDHYVVTHVGDKVEGLKAGDKVFFQHGVTITIHDEEYKYLQLSEVIAII